MPRVDTPQADAAPASAPPSLLDGPPSESEVASESSGVTARREPTGPTSGSALIAPMQQPPLEQLPSADVSEVSEGPIADEVSYPHMRASNLPPRLSTRTLDDEEPVGAGNSSAGLLLFAVMLAACVYPMVRYFGWDGSAAPEGDGPLIVVGAQADPAPSLPAVAPAPTPRSVPGRAQPPAAQAEPEVAPAEPAPTVEALPAPTTGGAPAAASADDAAQVRDRVAERVREAMADLPADRDAASDLLVKRAMEAHREHQDYRYVEALLGKALKLDDRNPRAAAGMARVRLSQNNLPGAEGWALTAVRYRPRRARYWLLYGDVLLARGRTAEARDAFRRALDLNPNSRGARSRLKRSRR